MPPRLASNTIIDSTFEVGRRFRCTLRVDCGQLDPGAVIRPTLSEWHPRMLERLDDEERADWRAGRAAAYQLAALTVGGAWQSATDKRRQRKPGGEPGFLKGRSAFGGLRSSHRLARADRRPFRSSAARKRASGCQAARRSGSNRWSGVVSMGSVGGAGLFLPI